MFVFKVRNKITTKFPLRKLIIFIFNGFIKPIVSLVKEKKHDEAITKYTTLTKSLEDYYGIEYDHNIPKPTMELNL